MRFLLKLLSFAVTLMLTLSVLGNILPKYELTSSIIPVRNVTCRTETLFSDSIRDWLIVLNTESDSLREGQTIVLVRSGEAVCEKYSEGSIPQGEYLGQCLVRIPLCGNICEALSTPVGFICAAALILLTKVGAYWLSRKKDTHRPAKDDACVQYYGDYDYS